MPIGTGQRGWISSERRANDRTVPCKCFLQAPTPDLLTLVDVNVGGFRLKTPNFLNLRVRSGTPTKRNAKFGTGAGTLLFPTAKKGLLKSIQRRFQYVLDMYRMRPRTAFGIGPGRSVPYNLRHLDEAGRQANHTHHVQQNRYSP